MPENFTTPELLAPAGNFEKLEVAIHYGADAVYLAGKDFSLRNLTHNFTEPEMADAINLAHKNGVKVYVACNIYSRNHEQERLADFLKCLGDMGPDAVIIADPGIILLAGKLIPHVDIHLSTQSNTTNYNALEFWKQTGVTRVNLARELSLKEIRDISKRNILETETFIHGAMCISYSGRCLLSNFLTRRDSNRGACSHPCRWKYRVEEEQRPGQYHSLMEDERGTYIFNSKDLCMVQFIPELIKAGITSLKIEGRMKGVSYLASVVKTYREAIDAFVRSPKNFQVTEQWKKELALVYHREYSTGFYFNSPDEIMPNYANYHTGLIHAFIGRAKTCVPGNRVTLDVKNKISRGDEVEIMVPEGIPVKSRVKNIIDASGMTIENGQPNSSPTLELEHPCRPGDIIRKVSS
ncbi:putative protease [Desulfocicer vacuolatum DSM 3385]|uniref:Putative protease n=1 Tax=Desulfocicer vacuolatum DSM 3385 TaxID=1121400 RepID=A0A1W1YJ97_9BACT|nr:U32 family peptidase [Desulfocicer vacuolatum]SMC36213.1 putative protease [Desulfocicer vacuolatum DSM 3385]